MSDETKNENLPTTVNDDGFDDGGDESRIIKGEIARCVDGNWTKRDGSPMPPKLVVLGVAEAVQRWLDQRPIETITDKPLPNIDELNDTVPVSEWECGLDGNPRRPYVHQRIVYLLDPSDAAIYTFLNSTTGAKLAVEALKDKVKMMRMISRLAGLPDRRTRQKTDEDEVRREAAPRLRHPRLALSRSGCAEARGESHRAHRRAGKAADDRGNFQRRFAFLIGAGA